jgi:hypothetical protein
MSPRFRFAPLLAVAAVLAVGCGGTSHSSTTTTSAKSSRTAFVAQADPICKQVAARRSAANAALNKVAHSPSKQLELLARLAPPIAVDEHAAVEKLRTLKPPTALAHDWQQMLGGMQQLADDTSKTAADAKAKQLKGVETITASGRQVRQQLTAIASRDGFAYCGRTS